MKTTACILIVFVISLYGQRSSDLVPLDVASNINCEEYLARIDNLFISLHNSPNSRGYIVISGDKEGMRRKLEYELWFQGAVNFRRFDSTLVRVIRGEETGPPTVNIWVIPSNSDFVPQQPIEWDFTLPIGSKAFVFHDDQEQICGSPRFYDVLNEYLSANPTAHSNVVIFAQNRKMYRQGLHEAKQNLQFLASQRVRFFYKHAETSYPWAEYWIVPNKKK